MKNNKEFKSTFDIIKEISAVWQELDDVTQANVANLLGGKRNANVIQALMTNFKDAEAAMQTASNAAGSALKENEQYLDSIQGKLDIMKGKFQELAMQIVGSDLVKWVADLGNGTLDIVNGIQRVHALLPLVLGTITTIVLTVAKLKAMAGETNILAMLGSGIGSMGPLVATIMGVAAAIAALVGVINHFSQAQQKAIEQADEAAAAYAENETQYSRNMAALDALSERYYELKNKTQLTADEQQEYKNILQQIIDISPSIVSGYDNEHNALLKYKDAITGAKEELEQFHAEEQKGYFAKTAENWEAWKSELESNRGALVDDTKSALSSLYDDIASTIQDIDDINIGESVLENVTGVLNSFVPNHGMRFLSDFGTWLNTMTDEQAVYVAEHIDDLIAKIVGAFGTNIPNELASSWKHGIVEALQSTLDEVDDPLDKMAQHMRAWVKNQEDTQEEWAKGLSELPGYQSLLESIPELLVPDSYGESEAAIKAYVASMRELNDSDPVQNLYKLADAFEQDAVSAEEFNTAIDEFANAKIADLQKKIADESNKLIPNPFAVMGWQKEIDDITNGQGLVGNVVAYFKGIAGGVKEAGESTEESAEKTKKSIEDLSKALETFASNQKILQSAESEMKNGGLSIDTVKSIKDALNSGENLNDYLYTENGLIKLNTEAWKERSNAILEADIASKEAQIATLQQNIADENDKLIGNPFAVQEWQKQIAELTNEIEMDKAILSEPLNIENMFSQVDAVKGKADALVSALDSVKNNVLVDWGDLAAKYPELMGVEGLFDITSLEGQEAALNSLLSQCQEDYREIISTQMNSLMAVRTEMVKDGKDVTGITAVIKNLHTMLNGDLLKAKTGGKTLPEQLAASMEKASKYADTLKSSMDGIDFGEWKQLQDVFGEDWQSYLAPDGKSLDKAKMYKEIMDELVANGASRQVIASFREMWFAIGGDGNADKAVEGIEHLTTAMDELAGANELLKSIQSGKGNPIDYIDQLLALAKEGHIDIGDFFGADGKLDLEGAASAVQTYMDSLLSWESVSQMNIPGMTEEINAALREQVLAANEAERSVTTLKDAISGINTANGFLGNIRAYEKTGEGDVLSMITQAAELAEREGFKINDFFTIVGDNIQWNSDKVVEWAQDWVSSIDGIDGVTQEFLNKQIQAMSQAERMAEALSDSQTVFGINRSVQNGEITSSSLGFDQYQELIAISKQYAYAVEYSNGQLSINKQKFDEVTASVMANNLAMIQQEKQAVLNDKEYVSLMEKLEHFGKLSDKEQDRLNDFNVTIMGFDVLQQQILGAENAYQRFMNTVSSSMEEYSALQKAGKLIRDTMSNKSSENYHNIGDQKFQAAWKLLIDPEIEVNSAAGAKAFAKVEKWLASGYDGVKAFMKDLSSKGLIDESNQLTKGLDEVAKETGASIDTILAMIKRFNITEPEANHIKDVTGNLIDVDAQIKQREEFSKTAKVAQEAAEEISEAGGDDTSLTGSLNSVIEAANSATEAIGKISENKPQVDTSNAVANVGKLQAALGKVALQVQRLATRTINIRTNVERVGLTEAGGTGWSAAPGMGGAPGGRTLVGELGRKLFLRRRMATCAFVFI